MPQYKCRLTCEYIVVIEAETEEDAGHIAHDTHVDEWDDQLWGTIEIEEVTA